MLRHLRIVGAWFCFALFVCFVVLWGQSYNGATFLNVRFGSNNVAEVTRLPSGTGKDRTPVSSGTVIGTRSRTLPNTVEGQGIYANSWRGEIEFCWHRGSFFDNGTQLHIAIIPADSYAKWLRRLSGGSFSSKTLSDIRRVGNSSIVWNVYIPHWLLVAICLMAAALFKPSPRHRFSIGELLVGTAVFACFFAVILSLGRFVYMAEPDVDTRIASQQVAELPVSDCGH